MELTLSFQLLTLLLATFAVSLAQQQPQQSAPLPPQGSSPLGVRYSAATDVSHISFSSPLVTYGSALNEIRLPAAPIQPATLKQAPQAEAERNEGDAQQGQTLVRSFGNQGQTQQQLQSPANQPQFISVQQYPQLQSNPQGFSLSQNLPGPQPQPQPIARYAPAAQNQQPQFPQYSLPQAQPQEYVLPQPQQYVAPQPQQYVAPQPQQYVAPQPQQYVAPQQPQLQYPSPAAYSSPASTGYFATGPFAAQYPQPSLIAKQVAAQPPYTPALVQTLPQYPQAVAPAAQLVSRVAFNGAAGGFSYGF